MLPQARLLAYLTDCATAEEIAHIEGGCSDCALAIEAMNRASTDADLRRAAQRPALPPLPDPFANLPAQIGPFDLVRELGRGGMGVVYLAQHLDQRAWWAVKVAPVGLVQNRFAQEAHLGAQLRHPNLCLALPGGVAGAFEYFPMEYINGASLHELIQHCRPLPIWVVCALGRDLALALVHIHALGIVHRDVKPANGMLSAAGVVKLLDLGLARVLAGPRLTTDGALLGTADYLAPEMCQNPDTVDCRADLYSLGCTLYELLTGTPPYGPIEGLLNKMNAHLNNAPPPITRPGMPVALTALLGRLLARDPADRPTAAEAAEALRPLAGLEDLATWFAGQTLPANPRSLQPTQQAFRPTVLEANLEILFHDESQRRMRSIREPGVLPACPGREYQLQVTLNQPAHIYLLWIGPNGQVAPVYPWLPGSSAWLHEHADEPLTVPLLLPRPTETGYPRWRLDTVTGVETVVLLARSEPLTAGERTRLPAWLGGLRGPQPLPSPDRPVWFTCHSGVNTTRGFDPEPIEAHDPLFQLESLLRDRLANRFTLVTGVQFTKIGAGQ